MPHTLSIDSARKLTVKPPNDHADQPSANLRSRAGFGLRLLIILVCLVGTLSSGISNAQPTTTRSSSTTKPATNKGAPATPPTAAAGAPSQPIVLAILVDGLSGAMIDRFPTPHLDRIRREGAFTHRLAPTFPAISGPTWVSLSTGCWPAPHGVVTDKFLDPELGLMDHSTDPRWLRGCELLQSVAERQGVVTAALGWWGQWSAETGPTASFVSSRAKLEATEPRDPLRFLDDAGRAEEIQRHLEAKGPDRPRLILAYFRGPDHAAHFSGLGSLENGAALASFDAAVGRLLDTISARDDAAQISQISLLIASDHGMVPVDKIVNLGRILRRHDIEARAVTTGTTGFLYFTPRSGESDAELAGRVDRAYRALTSYPQLDILRKHALPDYAQLGDGARVPQLILAAKPGYYTADADLWPWYLRPLGIFGADFLDSPLFGAGLRAAHGYAPGTDGNDGVLYAWGHGIKRTGDLGAVRMIDVHPTIAQLLGIAPGDPVDGQAIEGLLLEPPKTPDPKGHP
jgi:predicted AlkP superfamily pyrophosphatase or phosphodiesterase